MTVADKTEWAKHKKAVARAEKAVAVLERVIKRRGETKHFREAAQLELTRLQAALTDLRLLRVIYERSKLA